MDAWRRLEPCLDLGSVLQHLREAHDGYELVAHHQQGEFHHDVIVRVRAPGGLPAPILVVATNCNGGVKELLAFDDVPSPSSLWHWRCPDAPDFEGALPTLRAALRTQHWLEPCELLREDARSELREEWRERQPGGGWRMRSCAAPTKTR